MITKTALDLQQLKYITRSMKPKGVSIVKHFTGQLATNVSALDSQVAKFNARNYLSGSTDKDIATHFKNLDKHDATALKLRRKLMEVDSRDMPHKKQIGVLGKLSDALFTSANNKFKLHDSNIALGLAEKERAAELAKAQAYAILRPTIASKGAVWKTIRDLAPNTSTTPAEKVILNRIGDLHELHEVQAARKAARNFKKLSPSSLDTNYGLNYFRKATGHVSPEVLLREHNDLAALKGTPSVSADKIRGVYRNMRVETGDAKLLDPYIERIGGYGSTSRLSRHAIKRLSNKIINDISDKNNFQFE